MSLEKGKRENTDEENELAVKGEKKVTSETS